MATLYNDSKKKRGGVWKALFFLILILAVARAAAPYALKGWLESRLEQKGHEVRIDDLDLNLWRGAYEAEGIRISKTGAPNDLLFSAAKLDLSVDWSHAMRGEWVGELVAVQPSLTIPADREKSEIGWKERIQSMFPLRLNEVQIRNGTLRYQTGQSDFVLEDLHARATNLTNVEALSRSRPATALLTANVAGRGDLRARLDIDPFAEFPTFELNAGIRDASLASLGGVLRSQANVDVEAGVIDLSINAAAQDGGYEGVVRPSFEGLEVFRWKEDGAPSELLGKLLDKLPGESEKVLEKRSLGKYSFSGRLEKGQDVQEAVMQVLVDSFAKGVVPELESFLRQRAAPNRGS